MQGNPSAGYNRVGKVRQPKAKGAELVGFMSIEDVCELLKLSKRTVYALCRRGRLRGAAKASNQWRIDQHELLAWLKVGGEFKPILESGSKG